MRYLFLRPKIYLEKLGHKSSTAEKCVDLLKRTIGKINLPDLNPVAGSVAAASAAGFVYPLTEIVKYQADASVMNMDAGLVSLVSVTALGVSSLFLKRENSSSSPEENFKTVPILEVSDALTEEGQIQRASENKNKFSAMKDMSRQIRSY